ncbi:MAG: amidohydrolase family protein [Phenylobacterium sp.]|uniref:amidohydrolase family protein n=1 Tax=Phenylobacterium sp. TaxID=1871053 RepID=UPI0027376221|nr:amidohydrolase family protein [Phenylobacterium sp.]MDP1641414.1 amidohydrolase family protein [Phenylobacterium sp.]MDP3118648.1 amidohydrolase family protein [Phenylobacterium sp.]
MMLVRPLLLAALVAFAGAAEAATHRFVAMAGGEKVGHLVAEVDGATTSVDFAIDNNGRGPKAREQITVDASGAPVNWSIEGSSLFGSPVRETFSRQGGAAQWVSQADEGQTEVSGPVLYVPNDGSPWILGQYVKALLRAPGQTLPALPSGTMRLQEVRKITLGKGSAAVKLTVYELSGVDLTPSYVMVDARGDLFGVLGGGLIREGYEAHLDELSALAQDISLDQAKAAQAKLAHRFDTPVRIRNVRIFDPETMTRGPLSAVVVFGDRITSVQPETDGPAPEGQVVIDGQGGTLMPGLHDMHSHTSLASNLFYLAAGVTATRDQGNDNDRLMGMVEGLESGELAGPRIVRNGFLEGRSPYSARHGFIPETLEEGLENVRWYAERGYWQIKIYNSMNPDWVGPLAAEARRLGMGVTGHVPAFSNPDRVLMDGYDDIAHINQLMLGWILDPEEDTRTPLRLTGMARASDLDLTSERVLSTVRYMSENGKALDTTAMILERLMLSRSGQVHPADAPYFDHVPVAYQRYRKRSFVTLGEGQYETDAAYQAGFGKVLEVLKLLDDNNVQLLPGTDDGTGFSVHRELEVYVKAGISPAKTLRLATLDAERYFGRDHELGSIARGKLADLILVEGDPTTDISDIRQVRMTMVGGVAYYPAEIYDHLNVKPFAAPPPVTPAQ